MGDYIRGKKAYTKWDADSENIDIEYRPDGQKNQAQEGWLSGTKGKVIKVLLVLLVLCIGLIIGFFIRREIHEVINHTIVMPEKYDIDAYSMSRKIEKQLLDSIKSVNIQTFLQNYTAEPHIAGKPSSKKYIDYLQELWESWGLDNVHIEKFRVLLSYPSSTTPNTVRLINRVDNLEKLRASESGDDELHPDLRPYLAYSPNSSAEGKLVYANYGRREDFDQLNKLNVSVMGSVVIMRLGKIHRTNKIKFAEQFGAVAALLYPDPKDFVSGEPTYPLGLGLPGDSVIRGTLNGYPGDPMTPLQAATDTAFPFSHWNNSLPSIPVQPISYNNAQKFMSGMDGPTVSSDDWIGGLNISYSTGPGHSAPNTDYVVNVSIFNELKHEDIFNLLGMIPGRYEPDRYVIFGNHHDSWTNGTGDPGTGLAAFMEMVRAFSKLKQHGWQPGRTLVFACWDAEEFGMIGSTEWVELHNRELMSRAVAYINTDAAIEGRDLLSATGSPLLQSALTEATKSVMMRQHSDDVVYHHWLSTDRFNASSNLRVGFPSGGSDYVSFMTLYGISSLHLQFVGQEGSSIYPLYHSAYDNFDAFAKYIDPHFEVTLTMAQLLASLALHLTDNLRLPMNVEDYGRAVSNDFSYFVSTYGKSLEGMKVSLKQMSSAVDEFKAACYHFHNNFSTVDDKDELLAYHEYNDRALELERSLLATHWEVNRLSYRHSIYGPHPENLDRGIAFPQLVDAILQAQIHKMEDSLVDRVRYEISQVIASLRAAVDVLNSSVLSYR